MKKDKFYWITTSSMLLVLFTIVYALYRDYKTVSSGSTITEANIWAPPILSFLIYQLFSYFIKNPQLLVKKSLEEYENPGKISNAAAIEQWKKIYYYLRLVILLFISIISFL